MRSRSKHGRGSNAPALLGFMEEITTEWIELTPAYGRDYRSAAAAIADWTAGKDWRGDYSMGFALCSKRDFAPGVRVLLRYRQGARVAQAQA